MTSRKPLALVVAALVCGLLVTATPAAPAAAAPLTRTKVRGVDVDRTTIPRLQRLMNHHRLTSVQLTRFYLRRIGRLNPRLHAVIRVSPTALRDARAADAARRSGRRLPLLGIPVIVKDNIDTTGMPTTAGSLALAGSTPPDSFIVRRLKAKGALVIAQGEPLGVGELPVDELHQRLERRRRTDQQPLRARPQPVRVELRQRRLGRGGPRDGGHRHRDRRVHRVPVRPER